ncbi:MAG TPA: carbon-nitrogen hydrolase family protein [Propylenella sp.]|nr:carbon-nitrogen hydrolase family protein [Propylenella sp.]
MRLAAYQMRAVAGDVTANLATIAEAAAEAARRGAELLVLPELAITGYGAGDAIAELAEPAEGPQIDRVARIATEHGLAVACGFAERAGGSVFNSAALVTADGRRVIYRKCHLYGPYERKLFVPGGATPALVDVSGLQIGLLICYDVEFPEAVRRLTMDGADVVVVPTALPESEHAAFIAERVVPVRAFENQVALVYANHAGADALFAYAGRSCIVMPDGADAAQASASEPELIVADYEPARFAASRMANPYLTDRRADLF